MTLQEPHSKQRPVLSLLSPAPGRHTAVSGRAVARRGTVSPLYRAVLGALAVVLFALAFVYASGDAHAATTSKRIRAFNYALTQQGDPYRYGGNGPGSWDCSGLVYWAYGKVGLRIPRTTGGMLSSSKLVRTSRPAKGDLAFFGSGHVELYVSGTKYNGTTFGAHKSGTRVGYRAYNKYYHPTAFYHVRGAG